MSSNRHKDLTSADWIMQWPLAKIDFTGAFFRLGMRNEMNCCNQNFYLNCSFPKNGSIEIVAVRIVDEILIAGEISSVQNFIQGAKCNHELGTVVYGPTEFFFLGLQVVQDSYMAVSIHGDCKLSAVETFPINRHRRKQIS